MIWLAVLAMAALGPTVTEVDRAREAPLEVRKFIVRRADCQHWLGEEGYDAARRAEIDRIVRRLKCDAVARDEARLRDRYAGRPSLIEVLDLTEDGVD